MWKDNIYRFMKVSVMMAPKTSKSQVGAIFAVAMEIVRYVVGSHFFVMFFLRIPY
jgi:hypothetical protein